MVDISNVVQNVGARVYIVQTVSKTTMIEDGKGIRKAAQST